MLRFKKGKESAHNQKFSLTPDSEQLFSVFGVSAG
jgi:hypothetical protein